MDETQFTDDAAKSGAKGVETTGFGEGVDAKSPAGDISQKGDLSTPLAVEVVGLRAEVARLREELRRVTEGAVEAGVPARNGEGELAQQVTELRDANEHLVVAAVRAHELTEITESHFRLLVKEVTDCAIYMLGVTGEIVSWNKGAQRITGYTSDEIIGEHFSQFYTSDDLEAGIPAAALECARTLGHHESEGWTLRRDRSLFWADIVIDAIRGETGELLGFAQITRDVTERQEAHVLLNERAGELESLSRFLLTSTDNERATLAAELHDELGSHLIAVNLDVISLRSYASSRYPDLGDQLTQISEGIVRTNALNRRITEQLNPSILENLGLPIALESLCRAHQLRTGQESVFSLHGQLGSVHPDVALALYRFTEGALSQASQQGGTIVVTLDRTAETLRLSVTDIDAHWCRYRLHALPPVVARMRERITLVDGSFDIRLDVNGNRAIMEAVVPTR